MLIVVFVGCNDLLVCNFLVRHLVAVAVAVADSFRIAARKEAISNWFHRKSG
jgi:hypothetical protein